MMAYSLGDVGAVATVTAGPMSPPRTVPFSAILKVDSDLTVLYSQPWPVTTALHKERVSSPPGLGCQELTDVWPPTAP